MKKAIIYCFSGTGNTRKVSEFVAEELKNYEIETEVFSYDRKKYKSGDFPKPENYDLVGFSYPIYGFNAPFIVNRFVKKLGKATNNQQAFIIKTSGEPFKFNNFSSNAIKRYLRRKGYNLTYERHYLMPYNIMFRYPDGLVKQMFLTSEQLAKVSAKKIANGDKELVRPTFLSLIASFICKLVWIGGPIIGKTYHVDKNKCVNCGKCVNNCPAQNISVNEKGKYKFASHCMLCCRCAMNCPQDALSMGLMNAWKVNSPYNFNKLIADESLSANYVNAETKGYFHNFNKYFDAVDEELIAFGVETVRDKYPPNPFALMTKAEKREYLEALSEREESFAEQEGEEVKAEN